MKRPDVLLLLVEGHCTPGPSGHYRDGTYLSVSAFGGDAWVPGLNEHTHFSGAGDKSSLNGLVRKGLVQEVHLSGTFLGWRITEEGVLRAQELA